tara:strand:- start:1077 stop:1436 length:360 start_codon:yes stop_codon:yes gene_type:complete
MSKVSPKVKKLYYSIGEVGEITGLKAYVLRYWETEFSQLKPPKNRAGNRTYRQKDIDLIMQVKNLLYNKKYTIDGARSVLKSGSDEGDLIESEPVNQKQKILLKKIREDLENILTIISK